jgi:hypothetical protein
MCHLLEPTISTEERLCREAALWLDDTQYAATAAATFGDEHAQGVRDYHRFKLDELKAGGFTVEVDGKQRPLRVRLGEQRAELRLNITDQAARILPPGAPSSYRLGSGAAHSRPWFLERSATAGPKGGFVGEGTTAMTAALTVMYCMSSWVACWGGYFGLDVTEQLAGIRHTMETLLQEGMHAS